jgi:beta-alanine degradation protein BauB
MTEDAVVAAPDVYTVLFENERVRLLEGCVRPGESSTMHTHPAGLTYILQGAEPPSTRRQVTVLRSS